MGITLINPPQFTNANNAYWSLPGAISVNPTTGVMTLTELTGTTPVTADYDTDNAQNVTVEAGKTLTVAMTFRNTTGSATTAKLAIRSQDGFPDPQVLLAESDPLGTVGGTWTTATVSYTFPTSKTYYRLFIGLQIPRPMAAGSMNLAGPGSAGGPEANNRPFMYSTYLPSAVAPTITTSTLDPLTEGEPVTGLTLAATGTTPITWSIDAGTLPDGLTLTESTGAITGTPTTAGAYSVTIKATNAAGADTAEYTGTVEPAPSPPHELAALVAAYLGKPDDAATITLATVHVPIVTEYVRGYTRGRGFVGGVPAEPLRAVIVAACGRLTSNPRQVQQFQTGDYSERPAILAGWNMAELGVLRRYRRTLA